MPPGKQSSPKPSRETVLKERELQRDQSAKHPKPIAEVKAKKTRRMKGK